MRVVGGIRSLEPLDKKTVLTIGNFDGVHLGHRKIIERVVEEAKKIGALSCLVTFSPHPRQVLHPEKELRRLFDSKDQEEQLEALGVDLFVIEPFSRELSQLSPEQYLRDWVYRPLIPEHVVVGYDFSFGAERTGSHTVLEGLSKDLGFSMEVVPPFKIDGVLASSSRIRSALAEGDMPLARNLLGRPFYLKGIVERGAGRGRQIGFPTANLCTRGETIPRSGVYSGWVIVGGRRYEAVTNIGRNPTFAKNDLPPIHVESHILGFEQDIYGHEIIVEFLRFIRNERKFDSVDQLREQIASDLEIAQRQLSEGDR